MQTQAEQITKWYQEPWAMFVFSIPLATVIAGVITVWIAVQHADVRATDAPNRFGMQEEQQ